MHTLLLLAGLAPWRATSSTSILTRILVAVGVVSLEAQAITVLGLGTIASALPITLTLAAICFFVWRSEHPWPVTRVRVFDAVPPVAVALLAALVLVLNLSRPFEAADPYHLDKLERIARTGTLAYDLATDTKINILNSTYELILADLRSVPLIGSSLVRLHGVLGLAFLLVAIASTREWLQAGSTRATAGEAADDAAPRATGGSWRWAILLTVPVLFHQFVLVKNDLLVGSISLVVLAWLLTRADAAAPREIAWASWLTGMAVSIKLTSLPLAVVLVVALGVRHSSRGAALGTAALGGLSGALTGGLLFTLLQNVQVYHSVMPAESLGNRPEGVAGVGLDVFRFVISLMDLGQLTRRWWPGRGGWGGTFGLPLLWAVAVLITYARATREARRSLLYGGAHFLIFAGAFPDGDVAQRLALGPGLLLMAVAVHVLDERPSAAALRLALWPVTLLSCAQIGRSAYLYLRM